MAWSDQCKISFAVTVRAKRNHGVLNRSVNSIIKEISNESGIPASTLRNWWADVERATKLSKNGQHDTTHQNDDQNQVDQKAKVDQRPLCECGRSAKRGKIKADGAQSYYKSCQACLRAAPSTAPESNPEQQTLASSAMQFAVMAISQLERIQRNDPGREEAIRRVIAWIGQHHADVRG